MESRGFSLVMCFFVVLVTLLITSQYAFAKPKLAYCIEGELKVARVPIKSPIRYRNFLEYKEVLRRMRQSINLMRAKQARRVLKKARRLNCESKRTVPLIDQVLLRPVSDNFTIFDVKTSSFDSNRVLLNGTGLLKIHAVLFEYGNGSFFSIPRDQFLDSNDLSIILEIPSNSKTFSVVAYDDNERSKTAALNEADPHFLVDKQISTSSSNYIVGDNLAVPGRISRVYLSEASQGISVEAEVLQQSENFIKFKAPSSLPDGLLVQITVENGLSGSRRFDAKQLGAVINNKPNPDPFNLQVPWATSFSYASEPSRVINPVTDTRLSQQMSVHSIDNRVALQQAISLAKSFGGGVVSIPAGVYRINCSAFPVLIDSDFVSIRGAGSGNTILEFYGDAESSMGIALSERTKGNAIVGITLRGYRDSPPKKIVGRYFKGMLEHIALKDVNIELNGSQPLVLFEIDGLLLDSVEINQNSDKFGALSITATRHVTIRSSEFKWSASRTHFIDNNNMLIENNRFIVDRGNPHSVESGGIEAGWTENLLFHLNTLKSVNAEGVDYTVNEDEAWMTQVSVYQMTPRNGMVTSAAQNSVTDANNDWGVISHPYAEPIILLTEGKGAGQWRKISSQVGQTAYLEADWDVLPDSSSKYSITVWNIKNHFVVSNFIGKFRHCTHIYDGGITVLFRDNVTINCGFHDIMAVDVYATTEDEEAFRYPLFDVGFRDNYVSGDDGSYAVGVSLHTRVFRQRKLNGVSILGAIVSRNTVIPQGSNPNPVIGFWYYKNGEIHIGAAGSAYGNITEDLGQKSFVGGIIEGNMSHPEVGNRLTVTAGTDVVSQR